MRVFQQRRSGNSGRWRYVVWVVLCLFLVACHQDMYNQPKYKTYRPSPFFDDGRSARPPVPNTVAVGQFQTDPVFFTGKTADGSYANDLPFPFTPEVISRGETRYNSFCLPCHGMLGDGNGVIAQRGPMVVPTLHQDRLREAPLGYYVDVITNGFGRMFSYGARVPVEDRWAIAVYVRALQLSQNATLEDVPPDQRGQLEGGQ